MINSGTRDSAKLIADSLTKSGLPAKAAWAAIEEVDGAILFRDAFAGSFFLCVGGKNIVVGKGFSVNRIEKGIEITELSGTKLVTQVEGSS